MFLFFFCIKVQRFDKNNANTLNIIGATLSIIGAFLSVSYRAIIWEFENSIIGQNFSIIYKSLDTSTTVTTTMNRVANNTVIGAV